MSWEVKQEQIVDFMTQESAMFFDELQLKTAIEQAIPIYTMKKPNPKSGKGDCPVTKQEKNHYRVIMKTKLEAARTDEERQKVIEYYTNLFNG